MTTERLQHTVDVERYEFDFSDYFLPTDTIASVSVACDPVGPMEIVGGRVATGKKQTIYIDAGLADSRQYTLAVQATSSTGLRHTLYQIIHVSGEPVGIAPVPPSSAASGIYSATLSQSGTNAPVAVVNANTLVAGTPVWTRTGVGTYIATLTGAFLEDKTRCIANIVPLQVGDESKAAGRRLTDDTIEVTVRDYADNLVDGFSVLYVDIQTY